MRAFAILHISLVFATIYCRYKYIIPTLLVMTDTPLPHVKNYLPLYFVIYAHKEYREIFQKKLARLI